MVIGITGQSGTGKTTVSQMFKKFGFSILEVDLIAKDAINNNAECLEKIEKTFGKEAVLYGSKINRKILAEYAFRNKYTLYKLSKITNPYILFEVRKRVIDLKNNNKNIIIDAAILIESEIYKLCDYNIFVTAPKKYRIPRIMKRDKISEDMSIKRIDFWADFIRSEANL